MYIVIEQFDPEFLHIVCDPETGKTIYFDDDKAAKKEAANCQDPLIIKL